MNYRGSYRHLLHNAKAALLAAIEIYNKPRIEYRDECFVILLLNAWELALKALLSKNGRSIYYPKKRKEPYRTLSLKDAINRAEGLFPPETPPLPVRRNLEMLSIYRDNAVHFYNATGFGSIIYALAQTSIVNLKDLFEHAFSVRLADEITWHLLPLGLQPPIDPIQYIAQQPATGKEASAAVRQFLTELAKSTEELEASGADTARFLTVFSVKLESTKKIERADVVVGVQAQTAGSGPLVVTRTADPNVTHPLRARDVVERIGNLHGQKFTTFVLQAILSEHGLKSRPEYCWKAAEGVLVKYSHDVVAYIKRLSQAEAEAAVAGYKSKMKRRRRRRGAAV
jgi:hypothetical protein